MSCLACGGPVFDAKTIGILCLYIPRNFGPCCILPHALAAWQLVVQQASQRARLHASAERFALNIIFEYADSYRAKKSVQTDAWVTCTSATASGVATGLVHSETRPASHLDA